VAQLHLTHQERRGYFPDDTVFAIYLRQDDVILEQAHDQGLAENTWMNCFESLKRTSKNQVLVLID
jgi:hypothetical protein